MRMQIAMQMHNLGSWEVLQSVPSYLQRIHPQPLVHAWTIGEKGGQECLEAEAKVEHPVLHPLLEHAVLPRLADDQVRPLDDHDWDKEGSVAGVLELLPIKVGPLLPIRVFQIVHSLGVPFPPQTQQSALKSNLLFISEILLVIMGREKFTSAKSHFRTLSQSRRRILRTKERVLALVI